MNSAERALLAELLRMLGLIPPSHAHREIQELVRKADELRETSVQLSKQSDVLREHYDKMKMTGKLPLKPRSDDETKTA